MDSSAGDHDAFRSISFIIIFYQRKQLLCLPVCFPGESSPSKIGSTLKRKNLLLGEPILVLKSLPLMRLGTKMKIRWLLFMKVYHSF